MYAHCDMYLKVEDDGSYYWEVPNASGFTLEHHTDDQFLDYFPKSKVRKVFKVISPFELIVPKGYSLRQVPLIYDYNPDWHIAYGVYQVEAEGLSLFEYIKGDQNSIMGLPIKDIINYINEYKKWQKNTG